MGTSWINATNVTLHTQRQTIWEDIKNAQWINVMWKCFQAWGKVEEMRSMWLYIFRCRHFKTHSGENSNKCNQYDFQKKSVVISSHNESFHVFESEWLWTVRAYKWIFSGVSSFVHLQIWKRARNKLTLVARIRFVCFLMYLMWRHLVAKYATTASGAMLLINLIQVTESISGSVVPLAMFQLW